MVNTVYIHIPFCENICSYCDFCKLIYNKDLVDKYLWELKKEIQSNYKNETISKIYIGGGTPSCLNMNQLKMLFDIIKIFKFDEKFEFTFECNSDITYEKLKFLYKNKVNRLSIGIETFNEKHLSFLNRKKTDVISKIDQIKKIGFKNINIDLIYALPNQTIKDLKNDLDLFLKLDITHISTYSLIIEKNTLLDIKNTKNISEDLDFKMYNLIKNTLENNGYNHYEISNFAKPTYESKHNLTYWNNEFYYGFGLGSCGYIADYRYENTKSLSKYLKGIYLKEKHYVDKKEKLENEFILGFRKIKGINKKEFYDKYGIDINRIDVINRLIKEGKLTDFNGQVFIENEYLSNCVLVDLIGEV